MEQLSNFIKNVSLALAIAAVLPGAAFAEPRAPAPAPQCAIAPLVDSLGPALARTIARLSDRRSLTIVAVGSSSTFGVGANSSAASYPSRLEALLREKFPGAPIRVLNRGVNGEETPDMLARFEKDVIAQRPDLVLWQVGTNELLLKSAVAGTAPLLRKGIRRLKAAGADVVLIDPQYAPAVLAKSKALRMVDIIAAAAHEAGAGIFRRFALMREWHESAHWPFGAFVTADGLHMNDFGYDCMARQLAATIGDAATPVVTVATAQR